MKLEELLSALPIYYTNGVNLSRDVTLVTSRSDEVIPGALFVCIDGMQKRGIDYTNKALSAGAIAIIRTGRMQTDESDVPTVYVPNTP